MVIAKKEKKMCEGRLIMTDFKKLNPADFEPEYHFASKSELREEVVLLSAKGILYVNSRNSLSDFLVQVLTFIMKESMKTLKKNQIELRKKYPTVKSFDGWGKIAKREGYGSKSSLECLVMLLTPIERKRRKLELNYYGIRLPQEGNV